VTAEQLTAAPGAAVFDWAAYATALREEPQGVNPPDWRVDWDAAPWPVKLYEGGTRVPLRDGTSAVAADPALAGLARVLYRTCAVTRVRHDPRGQLPATPQDPRPAHRSRRLILRRAVPSGGAMYPAEAYVLLSGRSAYHYDPYRHELTDLCHPDPAGALRRALGRRPDTPVPAVAVVLANRFGKNYHKYGEFAYRLGAVDLGVALGRLLRSGVAEFGTAETHPGFADAVLDAALDLDGRTEGTYAVVTLGAAVPGTGDRVGLAEAVAPHPPAVLDRVRPVELPPTFATMYALSRRTVPEPDAASPGPQPCAPRHRVVGPPVALPSPVPTDPSFDMRTLARRTSNGRLFNGGTAPAAALATVLTGTSRAVASLCAGTGGVLGQDVRLYCAVQRVHGVPPGWYRYVPGRLEPVGSDAGGEAGRDPGRELQEALFVGSVNVELAAFTVHIVAAADVRAAGRGPRGYREQQLAVGVAVEALTFLAAATGLGGHPLLGFDARRVDRGYGLASSGFGSHAQVCVGAVRPDPNPEITVTP
jgi:SagB-type dehydrogenase family enzyme